MNKFYVYFHINSVKNEVFYVGKGHKDRAFSKDRRSDFWNNIVNKYGYCVDIIEEDLTEDEAFEREKYWISKIGRRSLNEGTLVNLTDGGEGTRGHIHSNETRQKISDAGKGRTHSEETKLKMSVWHKNKIVTEETKLKMIVIAKNRKFSDETRNKMSKSAKGNIPGNKGKTHSKEAIKKISESSKNRKHSKETKSKMSKSAKNRNMKYSIDKKWICNIETNKTKYVKKEDIEDYLNSGWKLGRK